MLLILLDHWRSQENMESCKAIFGAPSLPPPFPPFPPQSSVFQMQLLNNSCSGRSFKGTYNCFLLFCVVFVPFGYFWQIVKSPNFAIKSARDPLNFFTQNAPAQAEFDPSGKNARFCFSLIPLLVDERIKRSSG